MWQLKIIICGHVSVLPDAGPVWKPARCRSGGCSFRWSPADPAADAPSRPELRLSAGATAAAPSCIEQNTTAPAFDGSLSMYGSYLTTIIIIQLDIIPD